MSLSDTNTEKSALNFEYFAETDRATWLNRIKRDLKLQSLESLNKVVDEHFSVTPFADASFLIENKISATIVPSVDSKYLVCEFIHFKPDEENKANKNLLSALMRGVQTPVFFLNQKHGVEEFSVLFNEVATEYIFTHLYASIPEFNLIAHNLKSFAASQKSNNGKVDKTIEGATNITHNVFSEMSAAQHRIILEEIEETLPNFFFYCIDAVSQNSETTEVVNQIVQLCLQLNIFFRTAERNKLPFQTLVDKMRVRISVGTDYYTEIAKLRAIKIVLANFFKFWGLKPFVIPIDAIIYPKSSTKDIHSDKISATVQILAAYNGGANTVLTLNTDSDFNTRILSNIQQVLQLESGIPQINDVAAGSYYIEQLTSRIAKAAWEIILHHHI